jgi:alcohol dehydrogenase class IV
MAVAMNLKDDQDEGLIKFLFSLNEQTGLPVKLRGIGVKPEHIETLAELAENDFCHLNNPKSVSREDFKRLYLEAL